MHYEKCWKTKIWRNTLDNEGMAKHTGIRKPREHAERRKL